MKRMTVLLLALTVFFATLDGCQSKDPPSSSRSASGIPSEVVSSKLEAMLSPTPAPTSIPLIHDAEYYIGQHYEKVIASLKEMGIQSIKSEKLEDIVSGDEIGDGSVASVLIDGKAEYSKGDEVPLDAKAVVTYHWIPKISLPISASDAAKTEPAKLIALFEESGFEVEASEKHTLDPEMYTEKFINSVLIGDEDDFKKGEEVAFDTKVLIETNYLMDQYSVKIHVDFVPNLIFSKYDVDFSINGEKQDTLPHGEDRDFEFKWIEGIYTLSFSEKGASGNKAEVKLDISRDTDASYQISCYSDEIKIKTLNHAETEATVVVPDSATSFKHRDYNDVQTQLKESGFTNISTKALYDIELGWTEEGEVESVLIGDSSSFSRGEIFDADTPVVITFHLKKEDDPAKAAQEAEEALARCTFNGILFEAAYGRKITTKRDRLNTYFLFDKDDKIVYEVTYSKGPVSGKGTVEKRTYKTGTFEGSLGDNITVHFSDSTAYFIPFSVNSIVEANEQWKMVELDHDQWDPLYKQCSVEDVVTLLSNATLEE